MLDVNFVNCDEIRMGSPFKTCELVIRGVGWVPNLDLDSWQDLIAYSPDDNKVALIKWDIKENEPGFRVFEIDLAEKKVSSSKRIAGCCKRVYWADDKISWETFKA